MAKRRQENGLTTLYYRKRYQVNASLLGLLVTLLLWLVIYWLTGWPIYMAWLCAVNITTFALFGLDKGLSKTERVRIPERVLHFFTLVGGFVGQLSGRLIFHHKTNFRLHPSFTIVLIISVLIHGVIIFLVLR